MLYPPAIVPFTYITSFIFKNDINAQIFTLFLHFVAGGLLVIVVFLLQRIPATFQAGDTLRWVFTIFPSFCVTHGILFSASGSLVVDSRSNIGATDTNMDGDIIVVPRQFSPDIWRWENLQGDAIILILHFIVGTVALTLLELNIF